MASIVVTFLRKPKEYQKRRVTRDVDYRKLYRFDETNVDWIAYHFLGASEERRGGALTPKQRIQILLRYLSDPGFQTGVGEDIGVDQSTVSKVIKEVLPKIIKKSEVWIKFPSNNVEINLAKTNWARRFHIPTVIGALDCTHVRISKPKLLNHGDEYINRKGYPSINIQATCNSEEEFTSVDAKWPGSVHDSRIWTNSCTYDYMSKSTTDTFLIADQGYGISPWVITPFKNPTTPQQQYFNNIYAKDRVIVERCFGQLKKRFPILHYKIRLSMDKVADVIIACFVLHNIAKYLKDSDEDFPELDYDEQPTADLPETSDQRIRQAGKAKRETICQILYQSR